MNRRTADLSRKRHLSSLALHGGRPVIPEGPPAWPLQDELVHEAIEQAWRDRSWGKYIADYSERLRDSLAKMHGVSHVWLCCSGTFAVELALRALLLEEQAEVILAGYDFPGNFRAVENVGARPVLVDVEQTGWRITPEAVQAALSARTRGVIVSHLHGAIADMAGLRALADERGLAIVEDACQAIGASIGDRPVGSFGDVAVLSFGGSKLVTAGRGGAILTNRPDVLQRAKIYCERGNDAYPLSELQAAILLPQIDALVNRNRLRRQHVEQLIAATQNCRGIRSVSGNNPAVQSAYYKVGWWYNPDECGGYDRQSFVEAIQAEGVAMDAGFRGFANRSARRCRNVGSLTNSAAAAEQTVVLHHPVLLESKETIDRVVEAITKVTNAFNAIGHCEDSSP